MSLLAPLEQLSHGQLAAISMTMGTLTLFPYIAVPIRLAWSYHKQRSPLALRLLIPAVLLLPVAIDCFIAGIQEVACYGRAGDAATPTIDGHIMSCSYTQPWRQAIVWIFEASASVPFVIISIDRHALLADCGLIYLPLWLRRTLKAVLATFFTIFIILLACRSMLPPWFQELIAVPVFGYCGVLDAALCLTTLGVTLRVRRRVLDMGSNSSQNRSANDSNMGSVPSVAAMPTAIAPAPSQDNLKPASAMTPQDVRRTERRTLRKSMLARATALTGIIALQLFTVLMYAVIMISSSFFLSLPWVIALVQVPSFLLRVYFCLSILYLKSLAGLAEDGKRVKSRPGNKVSQQGR
ncbi:hypothetical protein RI367_001971 [Sorochytrium milnesiophthora]